MLRILPAHPINLHRAIALSILAACTVAARAQSQAAATTSPTQAKLAQSYGKLPLSFEANQGQSASGIEFLSRGSGYTLALTHSAAILSLSNRRNGNIDVVRMQVSGANPQATASGVDQLPGVSNYFIGNAPSRWRTNILTYAKVSYTAVYPGIDLVYYGNQSQLEYDFVLAPNADPNRIRLSFSGQRHLGIARNGDLILKGASSQATLRKPFVYQQKDGQRQPIPGSYRLVANRSVRFQLGAYDRTRPLIIDPILVYSTYLGGAGTESSVYRTLLGDVARGIAVDTEGNAYVVGTTASVNFPVTSGAYQADNGQAAPKNFGAVFVSKLNAAGTALLYSTYLSGTMTNSPATGLGDLGFAIAVDAAQNAYITGTTFSSDFPVTPGAFQSTNKSFALGLSTAFISKLNATGSGLVYSTLLGGTDRATNDDFVNYPPNFRLPDNGGYGTSIAVDTHGNAFVAGSTSATDFPVTPGAYLIKNPNIIGQYPEPTAVVTEINPSGSALVYSTYLGGSEGSHASAVAVDRAGNAYVTGTARFSDFPITPNALQASCPSGNSTFVTKFNPTGTALVYSTCIGEDSGASGSAIAVDAAGSAYVAGTSLTPFPVTTSTLAPSNSFVARLNPTGSAYDYASFVGGQYATATSLAVDSAGKAYVAGFNSGDLRLAYSNFPAPYFAIPTTQHALTYPESLIGTVPFVVKLDASGASEDFTSAFGGTAQQSGATALALDASGNAYLTGYTGSTYFATTSGAFQTVKGTKAANEGTTNAFVTKLALATETTGAYPTGLTLTIPSDHIASGQPVTLTATVTGAPTGAIPTGKVTFFSVNNFPGEPPTIQFPSATAALDSNGVATLTLTPVTTGTYFALARYNGDATHLTSLPPPDLSDPDEGPYFPPVPTSFTVVPSPSSIVLNSPTAVYGQTASLTAQLVFEGSSVPQDFPVHFNAAVGLNLQATSAVPNASSFATVLATASKPGTYPWTASVTGYPVSSSGTAIFSPASLAVTIRGTPYRTYGAANPSFTYTLAGLVGSDTVTVTPQTTATPASPVGTYPVTATLTGADASNYIVAVNGTTSLTVRKASLNVSATSITVRYGQAPPPLTAYKLSGFVNGDTASVVSGAPLLSTTVSATTPVGFYKIAVQTGTLAAANYAFNTASNGAGTVQVTRAPLTILPNNVTIHAGDPLPAFTYTITGFVNGDTQASATTGAPTFTTTAPNTSTPGRYAIVANTGSLAATNYSFNQPTASTNGVLTILPN